MSPTSMETKFFLLSINSQYLCGSANQYRPFTRNLGSAGYILTRKMPLTEGRKEQ